MSTQVVRPAAITPGTPEHLRAVVDNARVDAKSMERNAVPFVTRLAKLRGLDWQSLAPTWGEFCERELGVPASFVAEIVSGVNALVEAGKTGPIPGINEGPRDAEA